jgi:hypothetical protein
MRQLSFSQGCDFKLCKTLPDLSFNKGTVIVSFTHPELLFKFTTDRACHEVTSMQLFACFLQNKHEMYEDIEAHYCGGESDDSMQADVSGTAPRSMLGSTERVMCFAMCAWKNYPDLHPECISLNRGAPQNLHRVPVGRYHQALGHDSVSVGCTSTPFCANPQKFCYVTITTKF